MFKKICKLCGSEYKGWLSSKYCSNKCRSEILKRYNKGYYEKTHQKEVIEIYGEMKQSKKQKKLEIIKNEFTDEFQNNLGKLEQ